MSGKETTVKHLEVLAQIRTFTKARGYSPTMRNLMDMTGIRSTSTISYYLTKLEAMKLIRRDANISRGIVLIGEERAARGKSYVEIAKAKANGARAALEARAENGQNIQSAYSNIAQRLRGYGSTRKKSANYWSGSLKTQIAVCCNR